jgi:hypothetical protein
VRRRSSAWKTFCVLSFFFYLRLAERERERGRELARVLGTNTHPRRLQISARDLPPAPDGGEDAAKQKLHLSLLRRHPQLPSNRLFRRRGGRGDLVNGEVWTGEKRRERVSWKSLAGVCHTYSFSIYLPVSRGII